MTDMPISMSSIKPVKQTAAMESPNVAFISFRIGFIRNGFGGGGGDGGGGDGAWMCGIGRSTMDGVNLGSSGEVT